MHVKLATSRLLLLKSGVKRRELNEITERKIGGNFVNICRDKLENILAMSKKSFEDIASAKIFERSQHQKE